MGKTNEELKGFLKKLQALAERGVGGERETAQKKLEELMAANNFTESDLADNTVNFYMFKYSDELSKRLLNQIFYKILGPDDIQVYRAKGARMKIGVYCTAAQKLEIELDFNFYSELFKSECSDLLDAFIQKQELFPHGGPVESRSIDDMTEEERKQYEKQRKLMAQMEKRRRAVALIED